MKGHKFTEEERAILIKHRHIAKVTDHTVSFTPAFKKFAVTENVDRGRRPQDIFITEGIAVSIIGNDIPQRNVEAWRKKVKEGGMDALDEDGRGHNKRSVGRKKKERIDESKMSDKEIIEYYKAKCAYTDAENDFLARTRGIPRMAPFVYRPGSDTVS
jgi:hypothetical protein